ncbi:unnamed protein product, partial [Closterium sp. Naga37s-1]
KAHMFRWGPHVQVGPTCSGGAHMFRWGPHVQVGPTYSGGAGSTPAFPLTHFTIISPCPPVSSGLHPHLPFSTHLYPSPPSSSPLHYISLIHLALSTLSPFFQPWSLHSLSLLSTLCGSAVATAAYRISSYSYPFALPLSPFFRSVLASVGVLLLQLLTGWDAPYKHEDGHHIHISDWVRASLLLMA